MISLLSNNTTSLILLNDALHRCLLIVLLHDLLPEVAAALSMVSSRVAIGAYDDFAETLALALDLVLDRLDDPL